MSYPSRKQNDENLPAHVPQAAPDIYRLTICFIGRTISRPAVFDGGAMVFGTRMLEHCQKT